MSKERLNQHQLLKLNAVREKWIAIQLCTKPVESNSIRTLVTDLYSFMGKTPCQFSFSKSPQAALSKIQAVEHPINFFSVFQLIKDLKTKLPRMRESLAPKRASQKSWVCENSSIALPFEHPLRESHHTIFSQSLNVSNFFCYIVWIDFCLSELISPNRDKTWEVIRPLLDQIDYIFFSDKCCYVSDRPKIIQRDNHNKPHANGEPAVVYRDGFSLYFYEGNWLPEHYGSVNSNLWETEWLFSEAKLSVCQTLVNGIGLTRLKAELCMTQEDAWSCYELYAVKPNRVSNKQFLLLVRRNETKTEDLIVVSQNFLMVSQEMNRSFMERYADVKIL